MIRQKNIPQQDGAPQEVAYPAQFHFRIITDTGEAMEAALAQAVAAYTVTSPLALARASSGGRYTAYAVSAILQSRDEMEAFDAAIRKIPGVRMLL